MSLEGARCVGRHDLFESTHVEDHRAARKLCDGCPARLACRELLRDVQLASSGGEGGMPTGTWAGLLVGRRGQVR